MRTAVVFLTNKPHNSTIEFAIEVKRQTNFDTFLVIDDNTTKYPFKIGSVNIIQIEDEVCLKSNYYKSSSWSNLKDIVSWDRALYYFNRINPKYDHIWFMEDDVFIASEKVIIEIDKKY